jgi:Xaa-Pro aminopeptidase
MKKEVKELRKKFKKYGIDGYVVPKNDDYFTEYSKINRLKIISNFSGSAGLAIVLKNIYLQMVDTLFKVKWRVENILKLLVMKK